MADELSRGMNLTCCEPPPGGGPRRLRDRLLPPVSLLMAALCAVTAWQVATRVREYNSQRAVGGLIVAGLMAQNRPQAETAPAGSSPSGLPWLTLPSGALSSPPDEVDDRPQVDAHTPPDSDVNVPLLSMTELKRASAYAEAVVWFWERLLYGAALTLAAAGMIGLLTPWVRAPHLLAATVVILSTAGTMTGMRLLVDPGRGAFHPLPLQSYILAGVCQSTYAFLLLAAFLRPPPGDRRSPFKPAIDSVS